MESRAANPPNLIPPLPHAGQLVCLVLLSAPSHLLFCLGLFLNHFVPPFSLSLLLPSRLVSSWNTTPPPRGFWRSIESGCFAPSHSSRQSGLSTRAYRLSLSPIQPYSPLSFRIGGCFLPSFKHQDNSTGIGSCSLIFIRSSISRSRFLLASWILRARQRPTPFATLVRLTSVIRGSIF